MTFKKDLYFLIVDNNGVQHIVFNNKEEVVTHLNDLLKVHTGIDKRIENKEVKVLKVEVIDIINPYINKTVGLLDESKS